MFSIECFERCNVISPIEVARAHTHTHVHPYATVAVPMALCKSPLISRKENTNSAVNGFVIFSNENAQQFDRIRIY